MTGRREDPGEVIYPVNEVAAKDDASALEETKSPRRRTRAFHAAERTATGKVAAVSGVPQATLKETISGLVPEGEGRSVLNARDAAWLAATSSGR